MDTLNIGEIVAVVVSSLTILGMLVLVWINKRDMDKMYRDTNKQYGYTDIRE